jgi:hypothetical protein
MPGLSAGNLHLAPSPDIGSPVHRRRIPFIMSCARSGSTWLGKVFDSHPDVLYLHEPDIVDRGLDLLPIWFEEMPNALQIEAARSYLHRLITARTPRATGTRPYFQKRYRDGAKATYRRSLIYLAKGLERVGFDRCSQRVHIPDLSARGRPKRCVIKSVSALGRAEAFIRAADDALQPILLIRHPCGYVSSHLRGNALGVMEPHPLPGSLLETRAARRLGVRDLVLAAKDDLEKLAWNWLLSNAEAYAAIRAFGGTTVIYESLTQNALSEVKKLFAKVDLNWAPETEAFLRRSWETDGGYYSVFRDPERSANSWRTELGDDAVARITAIVCRDQVGELAIRERAGFRGRLT